jgi:hypothetical protein
VVRSVADAWSLEPIGTIKLGGREHLVPPLTFGRFQRLIASDMAGITAALTAVVKVRPPTLIERGMTRLLRWSVLRRPAVTAYLWRVVERFGLGKRMRPIPGIAPWVRLCVPTVTEAEWREHGDQRLFSQLFLMFVKAHDWSFIGDALRFGEPVEGGEVLPSKTQVTAGLLAIAKRAGYTIEALHAMHVDGFYLLVETMREEAAPREESTTMPPGIGVESDPEAIARMNALLDGATDGN